MRALGLIASVSLALAAAGAAGAPYQAANWWFLFSAGGTALGEGYRNDIAKIPQLLDVLPDPAFFLCSTNSVGGHGSARRAAVLAAMAEAGVPQDRILDGGECRDGVTGRGGDNPEAVFVAMGRKAEFEAYFVQR